MSESLIYTFSDIFTAADQAIYFDYKSTSKKSVYWLERLVRALFSCFGIMESTTKKCIRLSSQALIEAFHQPYDPFSSLSNSFMDNKVRVIIENLDQGSQDTALRDLVRLINRLAPTLISQCLHAYQEEKAKLLQTQIPPSPLLSSPVVITPTPLDAAQRALYDETKEIADKEFSYNRDATLWPVIEDKVRELLISSSGQTPKEMVLHVLNELFILPHVSPSANVTVDLHVAGGNQTTTIEVNRDNLVYHFKLHIQDRLGIPPYALELIYKGKRLENGSQLSVLFQGDLSPQVWMVDRTTTALAASMQQINALIHKLTLKIRG